MKKFFSLLLVLLSIALSAQAADLPYKTYVYDAYKNERAIPMFYEPAACEGHALKKAADLCCRNGLIYVLDAGSDRILVLDRDMTPVRKLENLGTKSASGLYVDAQGNIAIADTGNQRALVLDTDGNVLLNLTAPDSPLYDKQTAFAPDKVLLDSAGNVYVSVAGLYKGAVVFNAQGEFKGYYGGNKVETTAEVLTDWWWKNILTDEQRNRLNRSLPVAFTNFDMDARDFVYTCSSNIATTSAKVRKLNTSGISLWEQITDREITFGDPDTSVGGVTTSTLFKDIVVLDNGFVVLLDQSSHIFCYDDYANMLFGFHAGGSQEGLFLNPVAIDAIGSDLYVLDQRSGEITRLVLTKFGQLVFSALELYNDGRYLEAGSTWQQVLDMAGQYELAHVGKGMTLKKSGEHRAAMTEFSLGNDRVNYSSAYQSVRIAFIRQYGVLIVLGLAALVLVWKLTRRWIAPAAGKALAPVSTHMRMMLHPFGGMSELSISRKYSVLFQKLEIAANLNGQSLTEDEMTALSGKLALLHGEGRIVDVNDAGWHEEAGARVLQAGSFDANAVYLAIGGKSVVSISDCTQTQVCDPENSMHTLTLRYAAKAKDGQIRCADMIVNDGERIALPIEGQSDWNVYVDAVVEVELKAGINKIVLKNVENFDNSTYKAINVDFLSWALKAE